MSGSEIVINGTARRVAGGFDYTELDQKAAATARSTAERIRQRYTNQVEAIVEIGRDLAQVKGLLAHGSFLPWIKAEFGWSERSAENYMSAAEWFEGKTAIVADLPLTSIYALAASSTPGAVRETIVNRLEAGERVSTGEIKGLIADGRRAANEGRKQEKLSLEQRKQAKRKSDKAAAARRRTATRIEQERAAEVERRAKASRIAAAIMAAHVPPGEITRLSEALWNVGGVCFGLSAQLRVAANDEIARKEMRASVKSAR